MTTFSKKIFLAFFSLALIAIASPALADNEIFFEFAPDAWLSERLGIQNQSPSQIFQLNTDVLLTGFDFWLDNPSASGQITFTLFNAQGQTIAVKTIGLQTMLPTPGGYKTHIDLIDPVQLLSDQTYTIKITTTLTSIGIYHANRLNLLEHNQPYQSEYAQGIAKLDQEIQNFTFKMALYRPAQAGGSSTTTEEEDGEEEEGPAPTISITNARIVSLTDTTALLAWTTNIAADSRVTLRTQLSPLYIINSFTDSTLELEHAILITGLSQKTNYFADTFSSLGQSMVLTTYTLGFQTLPATTPPPPDDSVTPPPVESVDPPAVDSTTPPVNPNNPASLPDLSISSSGISQTNISWAPPATGAPSNGYRIDIFDYNYNLERQIFVPSSITNKEVPRLYSGVHHVVIYADDEGVYTKVATPTSFTIKTSQGSNFWKAIAIIILWIIGIGGYLFWKFKKEQTTLPPEKGYAPQT
ncbi:MAG: hypothetical protein COU10_00620 [Candidatus Harrisonbacteria bacterium CG10_big_fil_rev_8_21_14_0_10_45_28]|uniref:Fibronectin type-III domain-containing protein n=1 Tax=Candidatus Harrisonbacteria bacterium CG10_big_fil_rev_8_21_14_0_10_45_28 TaxID=1974586 RepID=A0A2H0UQW1_9BACT|nr:MAG: hypothetical protein COU10_00620 [Candidatus Harrisonbacteria bacterium CG10_big_fil_rev_8_21_14_0_10_45_28]